MIGSARIHRDEIEEVVRRVEELAGHGVADGGEVRDGVGPITRVL